MECILIGELKFELDLSKPLWEQIFQQVSGAIAREEVKPGTKVPSQRELAQGLKINPNTVMRAYQELEREGLLETRRGQGTFITASTDKIAGAKQALAGETLNSFVNSMRALGISKEQAISFLEEVNW